MTLMLVELWCGPTWMGNGDFPGTEEEHDPNQVELDVIPAKVVTAWLEQQMEFCVEWLRKQTSECVGSKK